MHKLLLITLVVFTFTSCEDNTSRQSPTPAPEVGILIIPDQELPDIQVIDWVPQDAYIDPCENATSSNENYCDCQPQCCQTQMWYCPPSGFGIQAAEIIMNICDENHVPCDRSRDFTCSPNEVLSRGDCNTILECPPGIGNDITISVRCEIEDVEGQQEIKCRKGAIEYGECIICEPKEERCNFEDDDCDGQVDEGQRNVCDSCGLVPSESCDGADNDCDGNTDEELIRECQTPCARGLETCSDGNWISCTARQPSDEECDGEDNDCDGTVDEQLSCLCDIDDVGNLIPCTEAPLICGQGFKTCECADPDCTEMRMTECEALCTYLPAPQPNCDPRIGLALQQEECNNFDEDCDQNIDESLAQACYTGQPDTLLVGVCAPGEVYCQRGTWGNDLNGVFAEGFCLGEVTPQEEICDGADNDCDGVVDYGEEIRETDILFVVDWSGSMDDQIEAVKIALNRFATHFSAEEPLQWGLIIGPKEFQEDGTEYLVKVSDISPFEQFLASFAALGNEGMDTGNEMLLDAVYLAVKNISPAANVQLPATEWFADTGSRPEKENFVVNWRPNSERIVIIFSDETEQSFLKYTDRSIQGQPITKTVVEDAVRAGIKLRVYAFSTGGFANRSDFWTDISLAGNGSNFELTADPLSMYNDLMSIIDEACLPREEQARTKINNGIYFESSIEYKLATRNMCF